jgi:hypothetical protein
MLIVLYHLEVIKMSAACKISNNLNNTVEAQKAITAAHQGFVATMCGA